MLRASCAVIIGLCCNMAPGQGVDSPSRVRVLVGEVPGLCSADGREGNVCAPIHEAIQPSGVPAAIEVVPFARMVHTAAGGVPTVVAPLGRTVDREQRFWFVQHLYDDDLVVWRLRHESIRLQGASIVVMRASAPVGPLRQRGARVKEASSEAAACRMLLAGRVDRWVGTRAARSAGCKSQLDLFEDQVLMTLPIYAAVPIGTPLDDLALLIRALKPGRAAHAASVKPS